MDRQIWLSVTEFQTRSSRPRFIVLTLPPHGRASARFQDEVAGPNRKGSTELPTQPGDDNEIPVTIAILRAILVRLGRACHANAQRYQPAHARLCQVMADIQQCWKGTGYHTSFAGRAQRPFLHSVTSRFALFRAILLL